MSRLMVPAAAVAAAAAILTAGCASAGASGPGAGNGAAAGRISARCGPTSQSADADSSELRDTSQPNSRFSYILASRGRCNR